ncbi:MAG: type II toxin-antitoxin system Phd/YefM family antitoxin [Armatimonadetes bacterium]|nr:type II toxin-antitoxin system Phd/YefM family antitoxin [Armatimonadota bacterium]
MDRDTSRVPLTQLRRKTAAIVDRVASQGGRIVVERRGKPVAALVPLDDLTLLEKIEELEDRLDAAEAERILSDPNTVWVPWEEVEAQLKAAP